MGFFRNIIGSDARASRNKLNVLMSERKLLAKEKKSLRDIDARLSAAKKENRKKSIYSYRDRAIILTPAALALSINHRKTGQ